MKTYQITAEFAFADGKITKEEEEHWKKLAQDLKIDPEDAHKIFQELMEQNPDTISLILKGPLKLFSTGAKVEQLTQVLVDKGYSLMGTGVYGPMVRRAVKDFQKKTI